MKQSLGIFALMVALCMGVVMLFYWLAVLAVNIWWLIRSICDYVVIAWRDRNERNS